MLRVLSAFAGLVGQGLWIAAVLCVSGVALALLALAILTWPEETARAIGTILLVVLALAMLGAIWNAIAWASTYIGVRNAEDGE